MLPRSKVNEEIFIFLIFFVWHSNVLDLMPSRILAVPAGTSSRPHPAFPEVCREDPSY